MGRSKPEPVLRRWLGARFTTIFSPGILKPAARMAARTRSRASWMAASGMPTMAMPGRPPETTTSTVTGTTSTPRTVALMTAHCPKAMAQPAE